MSLIDERSKLVVKSKRMSELRSWLSDDGDYNIASLFSPSRSPAKAYRHRRLSDLIGAVNPLLLVDAHKLLLVEFDDDTRWQLHIDNPHALKSITCLLLDQYLDMGIDSNPLMLDLTIAQHFHKPATRQNVDDSNRRTFSHYAQSFKQLTNPSSNVTNQLLAVGPSKHSATTARSNRSTIGHRISSLASK
jgi:hypothetical protein